MSRVYYFNKIIMIVFALPDLTYSYNDLAPYIDEKTMTIHHKKHHQGYVANLNKALKEIKSEVISLENIMQNTSKYPASIRNNGGGHYNHSLFWQILTPKNRGGGGKPYKFLLDIIVEHFKTLEKFKEKFSDAAKTRFGSGWAWLCVGKNKKLFICSTANQDNPLMNIPENKGQKGIPILCLDVWEHAYYLKYQNKRPDYIAAFWEVVNWTEVERRYKIAITKLG